MSLFSAAALFCLPVLADPGRSGELRSVSSYLFQVVDNAEQIPLGIHLGLATQGETVESHDLADVGKGRFSNRNTKTVQSAANRGINLALHLFGEGLLAPNGAAMEISHLPDFGSFRMPETG